MRFLTTKWKCSVNCCVEKAKGWHPTCSCASGERKSKCENDLLCLENGGRHSVFPIQQMRYVKGSERYQRYKVWWDEITQRSKQRRKQRRSSFIWTYWKRHCYEVWNEWCFSSYVLWVCCFPLQTHHHLILPQFVIHRPLCWLPWHLSLPCLVAPLP